MTIHLRRTLSVLAALTTLPYAALKVAWLAGSDVGIRDPGFGERTSMHVLNGLTLGLDVVALALAAVFLTGRRVPAGLVLAPLWVGFGLLGEVLLEAPLLAVLGTGQSDSAAAAATPLAGWVFACVYLGFGGLGLTLLPAAVLYALDRWPGLLRGRLGDVTHGHRRSSSALIAATVVVAGLTVWQAASTTGLDRVADGLDTGVALVAGAAVLALRTGRPARLPRAVVLLVAWSGSGALTAWGTYHLVLETLPNDLATGPTSGLSVVVSVARMLLGVGLLAGFVRSADSTVLPCEEPHVHLPIPCN